MPIVPGTQPVQQPKQVPYQRLPLESILRSAENTQERLNVAQDRLGQLQLDMAEAEVLPYHQQQFMTATEGIRERVNEIAEADQLWNRLPAIRREARKAAGLLGKFKQQKESVETTLESINQSNRSESQKQALKRRVISQASQLGLNDEGDLDPRTMLQAHEYGDVKDIGSYLRDELDLKPMTREQISREDGVITKRTFRGVALPRAMREAYRVMGFAQDEEGQLVQVNNPNDPEVQDWLTNERMVIEDQIRSRNPDMTEETINKKIDQRLSSVIQNEVRSAAENEIRGGITTNFQRDPAYIGRGGDGGDSDSDDVGVATWGIGRASNSPASVKLADEAADAAITEALKANDLTREEYESIREREEEVVNPNKRVSTSYGLMPQAGQGALDSLKENLGEGQWEAYQNVKAAEDTVRKSAMEQRTYQFNPESSVWNVAHRAVSQITPESVESAEGYQPDQIKALLANEDNFQLVDMANDKSWIRVKASDSIDDDRFLSMFWGKDIEPGDMITLKPKNKGALSGRGEYLQGPFDKLSEGLPTPVRQQMDLNEEASGAEISSKWTKIPTNPDVELKIDSFNRAGAVNGIGALRPNYVAKQNDRDVTVRRLGEAIVEGRVNEDNIGSHLTNMSKSLAYRGIRVSPNQLGVIIRKVMTGDTDDVEDEVLDRWEELLDMPLYANNPGEALGFAKSIRRAEN